MTDRTVRRDVDRLRELGYPVEGTTGTAGGYRLTSGRDVPPLLPDDDEAVAVAVGLRTASGVHGGGRARRRGVVHQGVGEAGAGAARAAAAPDRCGAVRCGAVRDAIAVMPVAGPASDPAAAITPREPPADPAAYVARSLTTAPHRFTCTATVDTPAAVVRERLVVALPGRVEEVDDRTCRVRLGSDAIEHVAADLLLLGAPYALDAPPEVLAALREVGAGLTGGRPDPPGAPGSR